MNLPELQDRINALKAEWDAAQPLLQGDLREKRWQKLRLEWNYHSNHIEGNTLTYGETRLLILKDVTTGSHPLREYEEMKAHDVAIEHVRQLAADERPLTEGDVWDLNKILLKEPFWKEAVTADGQPTRKQILPGQYKALPNNVKTAASGVFHFAPPEETPILMAELMDWFRSGLEEGMPIIPLITGFHHRFSVIHPFDDGNGRTMRLLVNYALLRRGYPPIVIRSEDKSRYLGALAEADAGNREVFAGYLADSLVAALELGLRASRGESLEEPEDWQKEMALMVREHSVGSQRPPLQSWALVEGRVIDSWRPMLDQTLAKLKSLERVFQEVEYVVDDLEGELGEEVDAQTQEIRELFLGAVRRNLQSNPSDFNVRFSLFDFQSDQVDSFDVNEFVTFFLEEYHYSIEGPNLLGLDRMRYDRVFDDELIEKISSALARGIFDVVKAKVETQTRARP